jgi:CheY-like chemotaxis protein
MDQASPRRILIVEDQREVSRLLRSSLETLGYELEVVEIPSGEEAILYSSNNQVDLLVSDYRLPGMSGIELMHKVQKNQPHAKIFLITGQPDPRIRKDVAEAGADAFFLKPIPMADFLDAVERHLALVETILPPEPVAAIEPEVLHGMPVQLADLRHELAASAVFLLNDTGRILARAGDFPQESDESSLVSSLLSIQIAEQKLSRLLGSKPDPDRYIYHGASYDLIYIPVSTTHAMLVIGKGLVGEDHRLKKVGIFTRARRNIERVIGAIPAGVSKSPEAPATTQVSGEPEANEMEPLLKDAHQKLKPAEVDEFWDKAAEAQKTPASSDMLSYDQARKLGLAPEDKS